MSARPRVAALVLAAGRSRRFGRRNKLLQRIGGRPLVWHAVAAACASRARPVVVVTGHQARRVRAALRPLRHRLRFVHNRHHRHGMASSLHAGLRAVPADRAGAVVCLGDMPQLRARLVDALAAAFGEGDAAVVPFAGGRRGNPVLLGRKLFAAALALSGDAGARRLLAGPGVRTIEAGRDTLHDVDTRRDWQRLRRR